MKTCTKCLQEKSEDEFYWKVKGRSRSSACKLCHQKLTQRYYQDNRVKYIQGQRDRRKSDLTRIKAIRDELKSRPCVDCGIQYAPWIMQFDHLPGFKKLGMVSSMVTAPNKLREEAAKCEVVCANCHAERTHRRRSEGKTAS